MADQSTQKRAKKVDEGLIPNWKKHVHSNRGREPTTATTTSLPPRTNSRASSLQQSRGSSVASRIGTDDVSRTMDDDDDDLEPAHGTFDEDEDESSMKIARAAKSGKHNEMTIRGVKGRRTSQVSSIRIFVVL